MYHIQPKIILLIGLIATLIFGVFAFFTSTAIDVQVGGGAWFFFFILSILLFVFIVYFQVARQNNQHKTDAFVLTLSLVLIVVCVYLGIKFKPFDANNLHAKFGVDPLFDPTEWPPGLQYPDMKPDKETSSAEFLPTVMDQGDCGSCWAASAAQAMHTRLRIKGYREVDNKLAVGCNGINWLVSPQAILDLSGTGCKAAQNVFRGYEMSVNHAIPTTACVPYLPNQCGGECIEPSYVHSADRCFSTSSYDHTNCTSTRELNFSGKVRTKSSKVYSVVGEQAMMKDLTLYGPISCIVTTKKLDQTYATWLLQSGNTGLFGDLGAFTSPNWISRPIYDGQQYNQVLFITGGHVLTIYGYGEQNGIKYWLVRNTWGGDWGNGGNSKIERGINAWGIESSCAGAIVGEI